MTKYSRSDVKSVPLLIEHAHQSDDMRQPKTHMQEAKGMATD
jgi:hypothetical protein